MVAVQKQQLSRSGIGASEISAIVGMNPYASPWDIWLRKTGQAPDVEDNDLMEWGHRLEPAIRQKYADDTGAIVHVPPTSLFHADNPWARATPDGIAIKGSCADPQFWSHLIQCKNVGLWPGKDWDAGPPAYVQLQEQWELYVTGLARADVAVLIGGNDFRTYTVHRDNGTIDSLVTIAEDFWRKVERRTPPQVDDSKACRQHFERKLKREVIEAIADVETESLFVEWRSLVDQQKATEKRIETIRNLVREQMVVAEATVIRSAIGDAKLSIPSEPEPRSVVNWKHIAELVGSAKCSPEEFAELVEASTSTLTPEPKAPTLYAPRNWAKENR